MTKTITDRKAKLVEVEHGIWELNTIYPVMAEVYSGGTYGFVSTSIGIREEFHNDNNDPTPITIIIAALGVLQDFKSYPDEWEWRSRNPSGNVRVLFYKDQPTFIQVLYSGEKFKAKGGAASSHYVLLYGPDHQHHLSQYDYCVWPEVLKIVEEKYLPRLVDQEIAFLEKFL